MSITHQVCYSIEAVSDEEILLDFETNIMPFTFTFRDEYLKTIRSLDLQLIINSQLTASQRKVFPFDFMSSYELLKPCIHEVLLNVDVDRSVSESLTEKITVTACDMFRANQERKVSTFCFIVNIEYQILEECGEDEDLLRQIMEATMNMGPPMVPASKDSIEKLLKTRRFEEEETGESCLVCLEEFVVGLEIKVMPCDHAFHGDCIIKWLHQSHYCPLCRFSMPVDADQIVS